MQIDAVDPGLYKAGRVGDTNKDTTNRRKRIGRLANKQNNTDLNINVEGGEEGPTMYQNVRLLDVAIQKNVNEYDRQDVVHNVRQLFCGIVRCTRL